MIRIARFLLLPFAVVYGLVTAIRNFFYRSGFFKSVRFSMPVICIGNLNMGGSGKTPHTEYLVRLLKDRYRVATLSRGFGRREYGFRIADDHSTVATIGDEPLQYYRKFGGQVTVAVESDRVMGVMDICTERPGTNLVLLDDAYQHRAIRAGLNILLTPYFQPFYRDFILPVGDLREFRSGKKRADILVVTKCPGFDTIDKQAVIRRINPLPHQSVFFSRIRYGGLKALHGDTEHSSLQGLRVILVTGIANSFILKDHLAGKAGLIRHFNHPDHHNFSLADIREIHNLFDKFAQPQTVILTTEKDAMRLMGNNLENELKKYPWYYQPIEIELDDPIKFDKLILDYAERDS